jgi:hypothetical protein
MGERKSSVSNSDGFARAIFETIAAKNDQKNRTDDASLLAQ